MQRYVVFSDESGSWHEEDQVYVRSWVVIHESTRVALDSGIAALTKALNRTNELKWGQIIDEENRSALLAQLEPLSFRVFFTVTATSTINWDKYLSVATLPTALESVDWGHFDAAFSETVKRQFKSNLKHGIFVKFYESTHISNAVRAIETVIPEKFKGVDGADEYTFEYVVDKPQMNNSDWRAMVLEKLPGVRVTFCNSHSEAGLQLADILAGAARSIFIGDKGFSSASALIANLKAKKKLIASDWTRPHPNPNPNLIFYKQTTDELRKRARECF